MTKKLVYRGELLQISTESLRIKQMLPGYNYGQNFMDFNIGPHSDFLPKGIALVIGSFVEVFYSDASSNIPLVVTVRLVSPLANYSVINGIITLVNFHDNKYCISINRLHENETPSKASDIVVVLASDWALENLLPKQIVPGQKISVVTNGMSTFSFPPQIRAHVLLPYNI